MPRDWIKAGDKLVRRDGQPGFVKVHHQRDDQFYVTFHDTGTDDMHAGFWVKDDSRNLDDYVPDVT